MLQSSSKAALVESWAALKVSLWGSMMKICCQVIKWYLDLKNKNWYLSLHSRFERKIKEKKTRMFFNP